MSHAILAKRIHDTIIASADAIEAGDFSLAVRKLQAAVTLMAGHPKIRFEETETEYIRDDLVNMIRELKKDARADAQSKSRSGGLKSIPIIGER